MVRRHLLITGQVQGVGFRPFVYRLASEIGLTGKVVNSAAGVEIEVQGPKAQTEAFTAALSSRCPPLARIISLKEDDLPPVEGESAFAIEKTQASAGHAVLVSPDVATCPDCLREMRDPADRRHLYPFINCTNCGPRYSITRTMPYDRPGTSMACFPLCQSCEAEYRDPLDRRFHAQPTACPACGPKVWLGKAKGKPLAEGREALRKTAKALVAGKIVAIKGLGGFHLACLATHAGAVATLRQRKHRPHKPLAVMVPDLDTARGLAELRPLEEDLLSGIKRPIVLAAARRPSPLGDCLGLLSPDTDVLGLFLPYTPLHALLLEEVAALVGPKGLAACVMTSGNASGEPIALGNREARSRLAHLADLFLHHDRDILVRVDDSVVRCWPDARDAALSDEAPRMIPLRRARGFTPSPVFLARPGPMVLGVGPMLKSTLCLTKGDNAFMSQHLGDLDNLDTMAFFQEVLTHMREVLRIEPEAVVADLHPDYPSTRFAQTLGLPLFRVQHHVAHALAVGAEHRLTRPYVALALDGTGLGDDKTLWGGECLLVDPMTGDHTRLGSLSPFRLPGGEAAVQEPWRIGESLLSLLDDKLFHAPWREGRKEAVSTVQEVLAKNINCPTTSSCGRLFDAVSAFLGLCFETSYEGQAAIRLEQAQAREKSNYISFPVLNDTKFITIDTLAGCRELLIKQRNGIAVDFLAREFHIGIAKAFAQMAKIACSRQEITQVALSGGVMQNLTFLTALKNELINQGLIPLLHHETPPNDACISLGQAVYGQARLLMGS